MDFFNFLNQTLGDQNVYKNVFDEDSSEIKIIKFNNVKNCDQTSCPITMVCFNKNDFVAQLPCNHCFNKEAIIKWVTTESATCPICRYKLKSKEVRIQEEKVSENQGEISQPEIQDAENLENTLIQLINPNNVNNQSNNIIITEFLNLLDQEINRRTNIINSLENDNNELQQAILNSLTG